MCGILGYVSKEQIDKDAFERALTTMSMRGPDARRVEYCPVPGVEVMLGHTRLAVIDPRPSGDQPMNSSEASIVFNGEIYNFSELKATLSSGGYSFKTKTDTEVLLVGYERWGQDIVNRIEGMFAFAIVDLKKRNLFCARDHFGKKPFYYFLDEKRFVFASELKALIEFTEIRSLLQLDNRSIAKYLVYGYVPSPNTVFKNVNKLEPATAFVFDIDGWRIVEKQRFWRLEEVQVDTRITEEEALEGVEEHLARAVRKRLIADVPLGVFLSGGVDSSLVAAFVAREVDDVAGFTVIYEDEEYDEKEYAGLVSRRLGIDEHYVDFKREYVRENFLDIMDYLDEPIADAAVVPLYFIARAAREKITVALGGDGGDEVFGGYTKYRAQQYIERMGLVAPLVGRLKWLVGSGSAYRKLLEGMSMPFYARQFFYGAGGFPPEEALGMMQLDGCASWVFEEAAVCHSRYKQEDTINRALFLDCGIQLPDWYLAKADRATMAASLEMRSPLLDKELAEYAFSLRGSLKLKGGELKYLLKKLASKYVPREIIYRSKTGFVVPLRQWIDTVLRDDFRRVLSYDFNLFDTEAVSALVERHNAGIQYGSEFQLLRLFVINYYLNKIGWGSN